MMCKQVRKCEKAVLMAPSDKPGGRPTLYDVAQLAGVSPSLVSLVLRNPEKVSDKRREAVQAAIARLGYRPSRAAATLAGRRTNSIGLVIDDYRNLWFVDLLRGMESVLAPRGYQVMVADARPGEGRVKEAIHGLLAMQVDGLVIAAEPGGVTLAAAAVPAVVAGWRSGLPAGAGLITNDDDAGGALVADHLLERGHRKIGHLTGAGGAAAHRRAGFEDRLRRAGADFWVAGEAGGTSEEDGYSSASWLLDHRPEITAIFAANDAMALGALGALKARGLAAPTDVSLMGYDNSSLAKSHYLTLTSVDSRSHLVGAGAAEALLARIQDPSVAPQHELIRPSLVVRGTTAALPI